MNSTGYTIELPVFEGPLDLLLELIERAELDITRVSLAMVTDQYIDYLKQVDERDLGEISSFLVIAARLLQIKSEALLPRPPLREPGEEDPGEALARQLVAYKKYKQIAVLLSEREAAGLRTYLRGAAIRLPEPALGEGLFDVADLAAAFNSLEGRVMPHSAEIDRVVEVQRVSIRDRIMHILQALRRARHTKFRDVIADARSRLEIVVSFLAMLELIKLRQVQVLQPELFGDIDIEASESLDQDQIAQLDLEFEE